MYGKQAECAIAVISRLAEVYDGGETRLSAAEVADSRGLSRPFAAKILSLLSQPGLVVGSRGPGGGYSLAKDPKSIKLYDVYRLFERVDDDDSCPFGGGRCGVGHPCPLHDKLVSVQTALDRLFHETTFEVFRIAQKKQSRRTKSSRKRGRQIKMQSYRAPPRGTRQR